MNIKQKIYLVSSIGFIIVVLLIWGIFRPLVFEIKITSSLVEERNEKLIVLEKTDKEYLEQLETDYNNIKQDISLVKLGFLDADQAVDLFLELENIAAKTSNQLKIEAINFPAFNLHLMGNFSNLMKFLGWLENSKYFIDVDSIKIRRFSEKDLTLEQKETISTGDIKSILEVRVYLKKTKTYENEGELKTS